MMMKADRRTVLTGMGAAFGSLAAPAILRANAASARVVVVGGGFGGATAARYLRRYSAGLKVTLIEPSEVFATCPFSNLYLAGLRDWDSITHRYDGLRAAGIEVVHAYAEGVDAGAKTVTLSNGAVLGYDRLVLSPGIDIKWGALEGYDEAAAQLAPHAWKAGLQTKLLKAQLEAMEDGGTFVMSITDGAFRCPPGPYERASMVAHYFKQHKPKSKILLLDSKPNFSKQGLFQQGWQALYGEMIEWVGLDDDGQVVRVDAAARTVETVFGTSHKADVLNIVPPQQAGAIARAAGVTSDTGWVPVQGQTFEAAQAAGIYVVGDATIAAPMPKSGFCANAQGKVAAAAIIADLAGQEPVAASYVNTCYSLVGPDWGISVAGVYYFDGEKLAEREGAGGVSPIGADAAFRRAEAQYGAGWYASISADIWGGTPV
ncbi:NAD(P)/FAD-dependent oxidoreductase [Paracoccus cavernae]|uniref:NAD(P)/FAD-dependent oxidoreductase n=1 Tax=Paracoccus cavernae TaxID=1571207 RepID=A0ABT8D439_9RHOB|nr:NAD(P)/FAD-dependent oxidoreductase [Paracoccus cavernae]